ncbi:MAG: beta-N-acetylglucosaminidase domain-containing protein, partial [Actinomycetes bacterium]
MRITGVVEVFYGAPWSHQQRLDWIDRLHRWGMTHYVWAAKEEPRHRDDWREPFTDAELDGFAELARHRTGVDLAVGLTPGPEAIADDVVAKLGPAVDAGAAVVVLSCD